MKNTGSYEVNVITSNGIEKALISKAKIEDMPKTWKFQWENIWEVTDFDCEIIVKLEFKNKLYGLMRFSIYVNDANEIFTEIQQIETNPLTTSEVIPRLINPVGKWLIWFATKLTFDKNSDSELYLISKYESIEYYRDIIKMEAVLTGLIPVGANEDGYLFKFTSENAKRYCLIQESNYGKPRLI